MGTVKRFGNVEFFYATNLVDEWFEELNNVAAIKTNPQYNYYLWVSKDN